MGRGLSQKQRRILSILDGADQGVVRIRELRNSIGGSRPSLSRSISRLEDRGLVERLSIHNESRNMPAVRKKCTDRNCEKKFVLETKEIREKTAPDGKTIPRSGEA